MEAFTTRALDGVEKYGARRSSGVRAAPHKKCGDVVGRLAKSNLCGAKAIIASRIKMAGKPCFDPVPFLDYESKDLYQNPMRDFDELVEHAPSPPRVRVHASNGERVRLLKLLHQGNRLGFRSAAEVKHRFRKRPFLCRQEFGDRSFDFGWKTC